MSLYSAARKKKKNAVRKNNSKNAANKEDAVKRNENKNFFLSKICFN